MKKKEIKIGMICLTGIILILSGFFFINKPQTSPSITQTFCKPDTIYVDLAACHCPEGTEKVIEAPEGVEETVSICKTIKPCQGESFYEKRALSLNYKVQRNSAMVSGDCLVSPRNTGCQNTLNLAVGKEFNLLGGEEQTISVKLEKIENKKAHFLFSYDAAPPAPGPSYTCKFVKE